MKQLRRDVWEFINKSKHKKCISSILQSIRTPSSSPCQLRLGVVLRHLSLSPYRKENLGNAKKVVEEFEKEYQQDMEDIRKQEREEETFRRRELPGRFMVKKLFRWSDKKYDEEYWARLERN